MKSSRLGVLAIAALGLAPCAYAEQHGAAYAAIKAEIDYCGQVDERHRENYIAAGAATLASVAGLGDVGDYDVVYDAVRDALRKNSEEAGRVQCATALGLKVAKDDDRR